MNTCGKEHCFAPVDSPCLMGEDDYRSCEYWKKNVATEAEPQVDTNVSPPSWGGGTLGVADLSYLASQSRVRMVGVVGPHGSGKTTLLGTCYLLLQHGKIPSGFSFSRSFTLGGWEAIAQNLRWKGAAPPSFPQHTTVREGRVPGILHFGMRDDAEGLRDLVLTDAPGEWFRRWAIDKNASDAVGARWISENADIFLFVIDCQALADADSGATNLLSCQLLAERLSSEADGRPVHIVWTKSDVNVPAETTERMSSRLRKVLSDAPQTRVTVFPVGGNGHSAEEEFVALLNWMLSVEGQRLRLNFPQGAADPFIAYRND